MKNAIGQKYADDDEGAAPVCLRDIRLKRLQRRRRLRGVALFRRDPGQKRWLARAHRVSPWFMAETATKITTMATAFRRDFRQKRRRQDQSTTTQNNGDDKNHGMGYREASPTTMTNTNAATTIMTP
jgi:hypothetical protein